MTSTYKGPYFSLLVGNGPNNAVLVETCKLKWESDDVSIEAFTLINETLNESLYMEMNVNSFNIIVNNINNIVQSYIDKQKVVSSPLKSPILDITEPVIKRIPYRPNVERYASLLDEFKIENVHDRKFIANKLGNLYKKYDCIDNYRICISDKDGTETELYEFLKHRGCCGFYDELIYNDVTKTYYKFGFNHGH